MNINSEQRRGEMVSSNDRRAAPRYFAAEFQLERRRILLGRTSGQRADYHQTQGQETRQHDNPRPI